MIIIPKFDVCFIYLTAWVVKLKVQFSVRFALDRRLNDNLIHIALEHYQLINAYNPREKKQQNIIMQIYIGTFYIFYTAVLCPWLFKPECIIQMYYGKRVFH